MNSADERDRRALERLERNPLKKSHPSKSKIKKLCVLTLVKTNVENGISFPVRKRSRLFSVCNIKNIARMGVIQKQHKTAKESVGQEKKNIFHWLNQKGRCRNDEIPFSANQPKN